MNKLLLTSLIGSIFFIFTILILILNRKKISNQYSVWIIRLNLLIFLFPFSLFSNELRGCINNTFIERSLYILYPLNFYTKIFEDSSKIILSDYDILLIIIFVLWLTGFIYYLWHKHHTYRTLTQLCSNEYFLSNQYCQNKQIQDIVNSIQINMGIKRTLRIKYMNGISSPCVFGVLHPVLFLPEQYIFSDSVHIAILKHELFHIKNNDLIIQRLSLIITLLHWYNPIVYLLIKILNYYEELAADEYAISTLSEKERLKYGHILLDMAISQTKSSIFVKGLGLSQKFIFKRRIIQLKTLKKGRMSKIRLSITTLLLIITFMFSTLPAFAYIDEPTITIDSSISYETFSHSDTTSMEFSEGIPTDTRFSQSNSYFTDKSGNIYYETPQPNSFCNHDFVAGTFTTHDKLEDGSCIVNTYRAERCRKCAKINLLEQINTSYYITCIH